MRICGRQRKEGTKIVEKTEKFLQNVDDEGTVNVESRKF